MELYESIRQQQEDIIEQNKASIIITRTTRTPSADGGYTISTTTKASQDVRIYAKNTRTLTVDDGGYHASRITKMIAKYDADIIGESATNKDTFTYGAKTYVVRDVKDIYTQGYIIFKECEIEEVS